MRVHIKTGLVTVFVFLLCLALSTPDASAKGKGGGKGRGGGKAHAGFGGGKSGRGPSHLHDGSSPQRGWPLQDHRWDRPQNSRDWSSRRTERWSTDRGRDAHPWSMQRTNEDRKLNHRLGVADRLDQLAERTGNPKLHETAERQREKAWDHYEKRLDNINSKDPSYVSPEEGEVPDGDGHDHDDADDHDHADGDDHNHTHTDAADGRPVDEAFDATERLTGRENALYRQLRNEQRKLDQRMQAAERLWETYEQTGNEAFAEAARALEDRALAHFDQRINAIRDFQERHGLTDQVGQVLQDMEEVASGGSEVSVLVNPVP